ncbi:hypothetical protein EVAR_97860_1 [Eumeta japonica]|uniref:Uncharacterized protein n=1 Tax=Eumeta variegata TaxID=151549 RepID=A0A4C1WYA2_EUMVA|nr:hypothetical protein EVAR_97860_1 [Eumeta japonica]
MIQNDFTVTTTRDAYGVPGRLLMPNRSIRGINLSPSWKRFEVARSEKRDAGSMLRTIIENKKTEVPVLIGAKSAGWREDERKNILKDKQTHRRSIRSMIKTALDRAVSSARCTQSRRGACVTHLRRRACVARARPTTRKLTLKLRDFKL